MKTHVRHNQDGSISLVPGPMPKGVDWRGAYEALLAEVAASPHVFGCTPGAFDCWCIVGKAKAILAGNMEKVGPEPRFDSTEPSEVPK